MLPMSDLSILYFFAGPVEGVPPFAYSRPKSFFQAQCEWATTGARPACRVVGSAAWLSNAAKVQQQPVMTVLLTRDAHTG